MADNLTPLSVLLRAMQEHWEAGRLKDATAVAAIAAPYLHGKASLPGSARSLQQLTDSQIDELYDAACRKGGQGEAAS